MARESDLGQGLGLGTSNGGVAQVVVECVRESARREGAVSYTHLTLPTILLV